MVSPISSHSDHFYSVHIDIVGPLPSASLPILAYPLPFRYLLTCVVLIELLADVKPFLSLVHLLLQLLLLLCLGGSPCSRFGVHLEVVTGRGPRI